MGKSGGVFCDTCKKCISAARYRKNFMPSTFITCDVCEGDKFTEEKFTLRHLGNNKWVIKNEDNYPWCGKDEWVSEASAHMAFTPDCKPEIFSFEEVIYFINNKFGCILK